MNKDDIFLLKDVNQSLRKSYILLNFYLKKTMNESKRRKLDKQIHDYKKCISLSRQELLKYNISPDKIGFFERMAIKGKVACLSMFHTSLNIIDEVIKSEIANNMKKVILSKGNYKYARKDIKLLVKFYLSIETRICMFLTRKKASFEA